jgi:pimeloyl-ACP methyl ester carboxylesterase
LKQALINTLKLHPFDGVPEFRILRPSGNRYYPAQDYGTYYVETEPGIGIIVYRLADDVLLSRPPAGYSKALLYVSHISADDELRKELFIRELINSSKDSAFFACDVRGTGESKPNTCGDNFFSAYGNDYFYSGQSIMLDYPYPGQKTFDLLRIINLLKSFGHQEIHLIGNGWGTIPATFAAVLSDSVVRVTLKNALTSYSDIAENEEYNWPLSVMLPGVLAFFDLPDCYRALAAKNLKIIDPWQAVQEK